MLRLLLPLLVSETVCAPLLLPSAWSAKLTLVGVRVRAGAARAKLAVTPFAVSIVTVQVAMPEQPPPDQPANTLPEAGVAASVTPMPLT